MPDEDIIKKKSISKLEKSRKPRLSIQQIERSFYKVKLDVRQKTKEEHNRSMLLQDIAFSVTRNHDLPLVSRSILESLKKYLFLDQGTIHFVNREKQELALVASLNYPENMIRLIERVPLEDKSGFLFTEVLRKKTVLTHSDDNPTLGRMRMLKVAGAQNGRYVSCPIIYQGEVTGLLNLHFKGKRDFSAEELIIFQSIASTVGQAIENSRLHSAEQSALKILEAVVENTNAMLAYLDSDMIFVMVNDAYVGGSGLTREELLGRNHFDLFPNEENEAIFKHVRDTGEPVEFRAKPFEYAGQPWRGVTYWDWILVPTKNSVGKVIGLVFSLVDVTETIRSKHLSDALNNINNFINSTLDYYEVKKLAAVKAAEAMGCESAAILLCKDDRWVVDEVYGFPSELVGITVTHQGAHGSLFDRDKGQPVIINNAHMDDRVDGELMRYYGIQSLLCVPLVIKQEIQGSLVFCYNSEPLSFTNNQVDFATKLGYSISLAMENARLYEAVAKRAQELLEHQKNLEIIINQRTKEIVEVNTLLRQSEAQHRQILEVSPDAYFVFAKNKIVFANPAALHLFNFKTEEGALTSLKDIIMPESNWELKELLTKCVKYRHPVHLGELAINKDTNLQPMIIDVTVVPVIFEGETAHQFIVRDITQRKEMEREIARLDRLNLIGEMAAGIGHEVRNPMTTVRGFLQLLGNKESDPCKLEYYDLMIEELDRANGIITEFLSLAKDRTVKLSPTSLDGIINTLLPLLTAEATKQDKQIILQSGDNATVLLNEKEIRQLIINLVRNGLEAMTAGGRLTIGTFGDIEDLVLFVEDEGTGINPEVFLKLGTPFVTTKYQGTGLGLSVCYSIANKHNAKIDVKTGPSGTTFFVRFKKIGE